MLDFDQRSWLRRRDQWKRRNPVFDAHVKLYLATYTKPQRVMWSCKCGAVLRAGDRPRDIDGKPKKHCGCRSGMIGRPVKWTAKEVDARKAEYRSNLRLQRAMVSGKAPSKGRFVLHDAHVKSWRRLLSKVVMRFDRLGLHDFHVKAWKRNDAAQARWKTAHVPTFRINVRMRVQVRKALKGRKAGRRWEKILGYTVNDLAAHLEKQLPKKMTLDVALQQGWHIDHIVPKSLFDSTNEHELKAAWSLPNLRLVPPRVNLTKSARREFLL